MKTIANTAVLTTPEYRQFIEDLKTRVTAARISAARAVNRTLILLYLDIGRGIVEKQQALGWGESVVEMVSANLRRAFPQISGFSQRNVWDMRRLYETYTDRELLSQAGREIHHRETNQILRQPVAEFHRNRKRLQPVANLTQAKVIEFLQQLVAEIPWGHNLPILNKLKPLRTKASPIGVAAYKLHSKLPNQLKGKLPTARQLSDVVRAALPDRGK